MIHAKVTPLYFWGLRVFAAIAAAILWLIPAQAAEVASEKMPVLFDSRERLPRPDLSGMLRLRFLTSTDFPPFNFADQTGRLSGFHVDLMREICAELDLAAKCQVQALPFSELEPALANSQGEAVLAGIAVTESLRQRFIFSRPFMMLPARFARNRKADITGEDARALQGKRIGVVNSTAHEAMLKAFFPDLRPVGFADRDALLKALMEDQVDAAFADALQLTFWVNGQASDNCCALFDGPYYSEDFLGEGLTIMLRPEDRKLATAIDSALSALSHNGRLQEIYLKYFPYGL